MGEVGRYACGGKGEVGGCTSVHFYVLFNRLLLKSVTTHTLYDEDSSSCRNRSVCRLCQAKQWERRCRRIRERSMRGRRQVRIGRDTKHFALERQLKIPATSTKKDQNMTLTAVC